LKSVKIITKWDKQSREIKRKDGNNSITIESRQQSVNGLIEKTEHFRISKYQADVSTIEAKERVGFKSSEIVLAFPVTEEGKPSFKDSKDVFAFLPVRNYGLNFVVQADFLLTSSREEIQGNNTWNSKLFDEIPEAFVHSALPLFKSDGELSLGFYGYLKYDRLDKLFEPILKKTIDLLSETDCVLSTDGYWMSPYNTLIGDNACKELFNDNELFELINKEFVSKDILSFKDVLRDLGCDDFSIDHMIECLKDEAWVSGHKDNWGWFNKLFVYLSGKANTDSIIAEIKNLKIFPLKNGKISSAKDNVFFPLKFDSYGFEECLSILEENVLPETDAPYRLRVLEFLEKLGISRAESKYIIDKHILNVHSSGQSPVNKAHYIGHIRYIKDHLDDYLEYTSQTPTDQEATKKMLGSKLWILTNNESSFQLVEKTYIGKEYRNTNDLERLFSDILDVKFISSSYLKQKNDLMEIQSWFEFLKSIMANHLPRVVRVKPDRSQLIISKTSTMALDGVNYSPSEELKKLFESNDRSKKNQLLKILAKAWNTHYSFFTQANVIGFYRIRWTEKCPSTFINQLKRIKSPVNQNQWQELHKTYIDNNETRGYFGSDLNFLEIELAENTAFLDATNVTYKVSLSAALERLKGLAEGQEEITKEKLSKLYKVIDLNSSEKPSDVQNFFSVNRVIYLPKREPHWVNSSQIFWKEPSSKIIASHYPSLRSDYREHESFFLDVVKVKEKLNPDQLIEVLENLEHESASLNEKNDAAQRIYLELESYLREAEENEEEQPDWVDRFSDECLLWTNKQDLQRNADDIFINDVPSIGKLFNECEAFSFIAVDHNHIPRLELFFKINNLVLLSKAINKSLLPGTTKSPLIEITKTLNNRSRYIARYFYSHHNRDFDRLIDDGRLLRLSMAEIFKVEKLILQLKLEDEETKAPFNCAVIDSWILVDEEICNSLERLNYEVANEIAKTFERPDATSFINQILATKDQKIVDLFVNELKQLPSEIEELLAGKSVPEEDFSQKQIEIDSIPLPEFAHQNDIDIEVPELNTDEPAEEIKPPIDWVDSNSESTDSVPVSEIENVTYSQTINDRENVLDQTETGDQTISLNKGVEIVDPIVPASLAKRGDSGPSGEIVNNYNDDSFDEANHRDNYSHPRVSNDNSKNKNVSGMRQDDSRIKGTITLNNNKKRQGQGLSYAGNGRPEQESKDGERSEKNMRISKAAVSVVIKSEELEGFTPVEKDHNNPGYDIHSIRGNEERFIEVKGTDGPWTEYGVSLSPTQVHFAKVNKEKCWFYIVEHATGPNPQLYKIQNPFEKITHFRFDNGWKSFASSVDNVSQEPKEGMRIMLKQINKSGIIIKVNKPGSKLCRIKIELENGSTIDTLYDPAKMSLE